MSTHLNGLEEDDSDYIPEDNIEEDDILEFVEEDDDQEGDDDDEGDGLANLLSGDPNNDEAITLDQHIQSTSSTLPNQSQSAVNPVSAP